MTFKVTVHLPNDQSQEYLGVEHCFVQATANRHSVYISLDTKEGTIKLMGKGVFVEEREVLTELHQTKGKENDK